MKPTTTPLTTEAAPEEIQFSEQHLVSRLKKNETEKVDSIIKEYQGSELEKTMMALSWLCFYYNGTNIKLFAPKEKSPLSDYILIVTMENSIQAQHLIYLLKAHCQRLGINQLHIEGLTDGQWILMDWGNAIIHLFTAEYRSLYNLDALYQKYPTVTIADDFYNAKHEGPLDNKIKPSNTEEYF